MSILTKLLCLAHVSFTVYLQHLFCVALPHGISFI